MQFFLLKNGCDDSGDKYSTFFSFSEFLLHILTSLEKKQKKIVSGIL